MSLLWFRLGGAAGDTSTTYSSTNQNRANTQSCRPPMTNKVPPRRRYSCVLHPGQVCSIAKAVVMWREQGLGCADTPACLRRKFWWQPLQPVQGHKWTSQELGSPAMLQTLPRSQAWRGDAIGVNESCALIGDRAANTPVHHDAPIANPICSVHDIQQVQATRELDALLMVTRERSCELQNLSLPRQCCTCMTRYAIIHNRMMPLHRNRLRHVDDSM